MGEGTLSLITNKQTCGFCHDTLIILIVHLKIKKNQSVQFHTWN